MNIKIETYSECKFNWVQKEYGSVLYKFGLTKADDGTAFVIVNSLEDLFELDKELNVFCNDQDDWHVYFGIIVKHDKGELLLEIKDNYD